MKFRYFLLLLIFPFLGISQSKTDSSQISILTGLNLYRSISVYAYYEKGFLLQWDTKVYLNETLSIPVEIGFSNTDGPIRRPDLELFQQSFYAKAGVETDLPKIYGNIPTHIGILGGFTRVKEQRYVEFEGDYYDDYTYTFYDGIYHDITVNFYGGFNGKISEKLSTRVSVGIIARFLNSSPKDYQYFVPGFGSLMHESNETATINFGLNFFYKIK